LQRLGLAGSAPALARLAADDPDRGVRLAAIVAVGSLGGPEQLEMILARTDARQEKDAAVRQQAWSVVMSLLAKVDTPRLAALADQLARRQDAGEHLISVLNLWLTRIPPEKADQWVPVRLRLGEALLAQDRPAEAAGELGKVHAALVKADKAKAEAIWLKWVEALLAADDVTATVRIAETKEDKQFAAAVSALQKRLDALKAQKGWDRLVRLARAAQERLATRLGEAQRRAIEQALQEALAQQRLADRQRVSELVARLTGADEPARQAAAKGLADMKARAVPHLVAELRRTVSAGKPDAAAEKAILDVLTALAPELKGYNPEAPQDDKIKTLDGWLKQLGP